MSLYVGLYLGIGLIAAGIVFAIFPPQPAHRPSLSLILLAAATFVVLWPFIALLGLIYIVGPLYCRWRGDGRVAARPPAAVRKRRAHALWLD